MHLSIQNLIKACWDFYVQFYLCSEKGAAEQVVISGILPILALSLRSRGPLTLLTAQLVAELAKECK